MQPERPTSVLVIAIFHFILGGLGLLLALFTIGATLLVYAAPGPGPYAPARPPAFSPAAQYQYLDAHLPYWKEIDIVSGTAALAISVLMIVAGMGCVQMKPWGRTLSLVYGFVSIIFQIARLTYMVVFFLPVMMGFYDALLASVPGAPPPAVVTGMKAGLTAGVFLAVLGFIFPAIVLISMLRASVAAAFRGEGVSGPDDFVDRYDRGGRRDDQGRYPPGYGQEPSSGYTPEPPAGYGQEPDDRIGPAPS